MFKRLRWMLIGAAAGAGGSVWARRRVRQHLERYLPEQVASEMRAGLGRAARDLRTALAEGRSAMAESEAELRARLPGPDRRRVLPAGVVIEAHALDTASATPSAVATASSTVPASGSGVPPVPSRAAAALPGEGDRRRGERHR